ncbi:hypothetical protein B0H13DRAFT_2081005 [Mycena leptocephala]|nr:hypothetical protein B0H13DRAFT_2081005 [Mycena leptocephala]
MSSPTSKSSSRSSSDWLATSLLTAKTFKAAAECLPVPYVQGAFKIVVVLLETVEKVKKNRDDLKDVCQNAVEIIVIVHDQIILHGRCEELESLLQDVLNAVNKTLEQPRGFSGRFKEVLRLNNVADEIHGHQKRIQELRANFVLMAGLDTNFTVKAMSVTLRKIHEAISNNVPVAQVDPLVAMHILASTYSNQGRWKEAEELQSVVLEKRRNALGEDHPDTLIAMHILASTYHAQGRWKQAEELEFAVLKTRRNVLGEDHPDTLVAMHILASTYSQQGKLKEAEELAFAVLETRRSALGEDHPDTLVAMHILASTYSQQGKLKEAEELELVVFERRRDVLGEEHPDTLTAMHILASTYSKQGRLEEAEGLQAAVLKKGSQLLGQGMQHNLLNIHSLGRIEENERDC